MGKDPFWDEVAKNAFTVFISLYALPDVTAEKLAPYYEKEQKPPSADTFAGYLPSEDELALEIQNLTVLVPRSSKSHHPCQFTFGCQCG